MDVKLAVDIVDFAHRNYYQQISILSGDADFMEALFAVRRLEKNISVLCIENKIMYKSLIFFDTYILILRKLPVLELSKRMRKNFHPLEISPKEVTKAV